VDTKKMTILLLDDDNPSRHSVRNNLDEAGFSVVTCSNAERALSILRLGEVDALITDVQRSRTNRLDLIPQARRCLPGLKIVVTSDFSSSFLRNRSLSNGADLFLEQPADMDRVVEFFSSPRPAESFSGSVEGIDIIEYLQFIMLSGKKMILEVTSNGSGCGTVYLSNGRVLHATCGDLDGEEAVYRCLGFRGGKFSHLPWRDPKKVTIDKPGEFLLVEAARKRDEQVGGDQREVE